MSTVTDAENFIASIADNQIGDKIFCYSGERIDALRSAINDAKGFESTIPDDYILANVNLANLLSDAKQKNMPDSNKAYIIRHKQSGLVLNVSKDSLKITEYGSGNDYRHFTFVPGEDMNKVYLKSLSGLYASISTAIYWNILGVTDITDESLVSNEIDCMGDYYRIRTTHGIMGTNLLENNSKVYNDKSENDADAMTRAEWLIEEYTPNISLEEKAGELQKVISDAESAYNSSWIGTYPLQISQENVDSLNAIISRVQNFDYATCEEYDMAITTINNAVSNLKRLNIPDKETNYCLYNTIGYNLSSDNGIILEWPDNMNSSQHFSLIAVDGKINTYNILCNGYYISVLSSTMHNMTLAETPRGEYGEFIATQVGDSLFTLRSCNGYLGCDDTLSLICVPNATENTEWKLTEASPTTSIENSSYTDIVDYAIRYDKERQVVGFVSYDMQVLADINVCIYTTGGRLLYIFNADKEQSLVELPSGTYIVQWEYKGEKKSIKFRKDN